MPLERSLLVELETTFADGSADRHVEICAGSPTCFMASASQYSDEQVGLFDGVIMRLAEKIETKARAELANLLAPSQYAPPATVRQLARDPSIEVAGPILSQSVRLTDDDLLAIAQDDNHGRTARTGCWRFRSAPRSARTISDVLVTRGNRDVVLSVTQNEGASFSDAGYGTLVDRSIDDEVLAICVGMRKDIPRKHFHTLISKASQVVLAKLAAANPDRRRRSAKGTGRHHRAAGRRRTVGHRQFRAKPRPGSTACDSRASRPTRSFRSWRQAANSRKPSPP